LQRSSDIVILPYGWYHATFDTSDWTVGLGAQSEASYYGKTAFPATAAGFAASSGNTSSGVKFSSALLELAARGGHNAAVEQMLSEKVSSGSALHLASRSGHVEVVKTLLTHNANVNAPLKARDRGDGSGPTSLDLAVTEGRADCVKLLLEHNAHPDPAVNLMGRAAEQGHSQVVDTLVRMGRDVNQKDHFGATALHMATRSGHDGLVSHLLNVRADPNAKIDDGRDGLTPAQVAYFEGHVKIRDILEQAQQRKKGRSPADEM
jgi:ankyrin repeat protein